MGERSNIFGRVRVADYTPHVVNCFGCQIGIENPNHRWAHRPHVEIEKFRTSRFLGEEGLPVLDDDVRDVLRAEVSG